MRLALYQLYTRKGEPKMQAQSPMQAAYSENAALLHLLFRPVVLPPDLIGHPTPCDIFSARGTLLLKTGSMISPRAHHPMQAQRIFCQAEQAHHISALDPINELKQVSLALSNIAERAAHCAIVTPSELIALARQVLEAWFFDADACLGYARLSQYGSPSTCHVIHTALLAAELARANGLNDDLIESVVGAALTMNLAKQSLHDEMFNLDRVPSAEMKREMRTHPAASALLLQQIGLGNEDWINAVTAHHENIDGSGYPAGLRGTAISLPARIVRVADTLAARLTGRKVRAPRHWNLHHARGDINHLVAHVFGADLKRLDSPLCHKLLRVLNRFPPGSLVRLNNNELAVITRRQSDKTLPPRTVFAVSDTHGKPLLTPCVRHIIPRRCEIRAYAHDALPKLSNVDWQKAWGYGL